MSDVQALGSALSSAEDQHQAYLAIMNGMLQIAGVGQGKIESVQAALELFKLVNLEGENKEKLDKIKASLLKNIKKSKALNPEQKKNIESKIGHVSQALLDGLMLRQAIETGEQKKIMESLKKAYQSSREALVENLDAKTLETMRQMPVFKVFLGVDLLADPRLQIAAGAFSAVHASLSSQMTPENIAKLNLSPEAANRMGQANLVMQAAEALGLEDKVIKSSFFSQVIARVGISPQLAEHIVHSVAPVAAAAFSGAVQGSAVPAIGTLLGALLCAGAAAAKATYEGYGIWKKEKAASELVKDAQEMEKGQEDQLGLGGDNLSAVNQTVTPKFDAATAAAAAAAAALTKSNTVPVAAPPLPGNQSPKPK